MAKTEKTTDKFNKQNKNPRRLLNKQTPLFSLSRLDVVKRQVLMKRYFRKNYIIIKSKPEAVIKAFLSHDPNEMCISSITYAELMHGVEKSLAVEKNRPAMSLFLSPITIVPFDDQAAEAYGRLRAALEKKGTPLGPMDMLIAGHALANNFILVSNNRKEFDRVENLKVENWI